MTIDALLAGLAGGVARSASDLEIAVVQVPVETRTVVQALLLALAVGYDGDLIIACLQKGATVNRSTPMVDGLVVGRRLLGVVQHMAYRSSHMFV